MCLSSVCQMPLSSARFISELTADCLNQCDLFNTYLPCRIMELSCTLHTCTLYACTLNACTLCAALCVLHPACCTLYTCVTYKIVRYDHIFVLSWEALEDFIMHEQITKDCTIFHLVLNLSNHESLSLMNFIMICFEDGNRWFLINATCIISRRKGLNKSVRKEQSPKGAMSEDELGNQSLDVLWSWPMELLRWATYLRIWG